MATVTKIYTVYTLGPILTIHSNQPPIYEEEKVVFVKLSGNEISFERKNVICIDETNYVAGASEPATN